MKEQEEMKVVQSIYNDLDKSISKILNDYPHKKKLSPNGYKSTVDMALAGIMIDGINDLSLEKQLQFVDQTCRLMKDMVHQQNEKEKS